MKQWFVILLVALVSASSYAAEDTLFYVNDKPSVVYGDWKDGHRTIFFYDLKGERTYQLDEVRLSYTVSAKLSFHQNGGVDKAVIHQEPGGSPYYTVTTITFNGTNIPCTKKVEERPLRLEKLDKSNLWFWNRKKGIWVKQEVISCQPVPEPLSK
jgi:hypothetical protein